MKNLGSVFAAYVLGWAVFFVYFVTVARRFSSLRDDVDRLKKLQDRGK